MKKSIHVGFGIPTLMLIFTILCLSVFALFSYISGYNSLQHATKYEQSVTAYYQSYEKVMKIKIALEENQLSNSQKKIII